MKLADQFAALWRLTNCRGDAQEAYAALESRYREPHRHYHTLAHIAHCLKEFEEVSHLCADALAVQWALWYHDVVYDTHRNDNEERSAEMANAVLTIAGLSEAFRSKVINLILTTKHTATLTDPDACLVVDIDLAILGNQHMFWAYEDWIRNEYKWVLWFVFRRTRAKILQRFLNRGPIYTTDYFRAKYEEQAQKNLLLSIGRLRRFWGFI